MPCYSDRQGREWILGRWKGDEESRADESERYVYLASIGVSGFGVDELVRSEEV